MKKRSASALAAAVLILPMVSACSSSPDYCDQLDDTKQAFTELRDTNILQDGTDTLNERFDTFEEDVDSLIDAAGDEFSEESAAVEASLTQVSAALESAANLDLGTAASQIGPALDSLSASSQELLDAVTSACS